MKSFALWSFVLLIIHSPTLALGANKTLFEGYYKITSGGKHVGYYIQRYELNPKLKQFVSTYFLRTNALGGNISESLSAHSSDKLNPIKYNFTSLQGKKAKTVDVNIRKSKKGESMMQIKITENGKLRVSEQKIGKGTFFSTFLIYLLLQGEKGLSAGAKYNFRAVAEEDGKAFPGEVFVDSTTKMRNQEAYKVLYTFKRTHFVNFVNTQGDVLSSISPALDISAELVANPDDATKGMPFNEKTLKHLFGAIPKGNVHRLAPVATTPTQAPAMTLTPTTGEKPKEEKKSK